VWEKILVENVNMTISYTKENVQIVKRQDVEKSGGLYLNVKDLTAKWVKEK